MDDEYRQALYNVLDSSWRHRYASFFCINYYFVLAFVVHSSISALMHDSPAPHASLLLEIETAPKSLFSCVSLGHLLHTMVNVA